MLMIKYSDRLSMSPHGSYSIFGAEVDEQTTSLGAEDIGHGLRKWYGHIHDTLMQERH